MTKVRVEHIKSDKLHPLNCQYGPQILQESYLELDVITGKLSASCSGEGNSVPEPVWIGLRRQYEINHSLTRGEINNLMDHIAPIAQRVLDGITVGDYSESISMTEDVDNAESDIRHECEDALEYSNAVQLGEGVWDADVYYNITTDYEEMGLTSETTDEQLKQIIEDEQHVAESDGRTVNGLEDYLENELKTLRENALEETE